MENKPFIFGVATSGDNFTDREKETERLLLNFRHGVNTVLISPRRWGKTSLVQKVCRLAQSDKLKVVYLDIFSCRSDKDFYDAFAAAVLKQTSSKLDEWLENAKLFLSRISPKISMSTDPMTDFSISLEINPKSSDINEIGTQDWIKYICRRFEVTGKQISEELAEKICQKVDNHSSYVQQLAWLVWIHTDRVATEQDFEAAYQDIIDQNTPLFEKQTESLTTYQMNFLRAIIDGIHSEFTTQEVLHKYQLGSSANVSIVKRALVKKELIEIEKRQVIIPDPVMKVWLKRELGI